MYLLRYDEVILKGKNRPFFENKLIENIKSMAKLKNYKIDVIKKHTRIILNGEFENDFPSKIFGIRNYSPVIEVDADIDKIKQEINKLIKNINFNTFRINARRITKDFPMKSIEINQILGKYVKDEFNKTVNLENYDLEIGIEFIKDKAYIYTKTYKGLGGLPYGIEGKVLSLISGGIDSPVAAFLVMKRGADLTFIHYKTTDEILKKVKKLVDVLNTYAPKTLELIVEDHKELIKNAVINLKELNREEWTCVFCKHLMLYRASEISRDINSMALVTGESLGQVASQTLKNIYAENYGINIPVLRPLIGFDKLEIVNIAKMIGTYDISISVKGCGCPFKPDHPITNAQLEKFLELRDIVLKKIPNSNEFLEKNSC